LLQFDSWLPNLSLVLNFSPGFHAGFGLEVILGSPQLSSDSEFLLHTP
jgi:hypothetical protein